MQRWLFIGLGVFGAILNVQAIAQSIPDAGVILKQIERNIPSIVLPEVSKSIGVPAVQMISDNGETIIVKRFSFNGNHLVSNAELSARLGEYLNRNVSFSDLQNAAATIALIYQEKKYLASASVPKQEVIDGVVIIEIVEAKFAGAVVDESSTTRFDREILKGIANASLSIGALIDFNQIDRALLLMNDLPGLTVTGGMSADGDVGQSKLILLAKDAELIGGNFNVENTGSRATGNIVSTATAWLNSPLGYGDQAILSLRHSEGSEYGRLALKTSLGWNGARLGVSVSNLSYKLISSEFLSGQYHGESSNFGLDLSYPIIRSQATNLYYLALYNRKYFKNLTGSSAITDYHSDTFLMGLSGNHRDEWFGGGVSQFSLTYTHGILDLSNSPNKSNVAATTNTEGEFDKVNASFSRFFLLPNNFSFRAGIDSQYAFKNLDTSEKFSIGGSDSVRGYPVSEGTGSIGASGFIQLRKKITAEIEPWIFIDWGRVQQNVKNDFSGASTPNTLDYASQGFGIDWVGSRRVKSQLVWARRIGRNPNPNASTGYDQDGSKVLNRFWFNLNVSFQ